MRKLKDVTIEITSKCNFNCAHCGNNSGTINKNNLTKLEILNLIDQMYNLKVERLGISGGEPFCDENLFDYLEYAKDKVPNVVISTNGYLIDEEKANMLKKCKINKVIISLDGAKEYHDTFRGKKNAYKNALNAIKLLTDAKIDVKIRSVLTKENMFSLLELMSITNQLKVKSHEILPVCPIGRTTNRMLLSPSEYKYFLINAIQKINSFNHINIIYELKPAFNQEDLFKNVPEECREKSLNYRCDGFDTSLEICYNGDVIGCSFIRLSVGNIREQTLDKLWNSKEALIYRNMIMNHNKIGECKDCQHNEKCNGGCLANKLYGNGIDKKDIYCFVRRRIKNV